MLFEIMLKRNYETENKFMIRITWSLSFHKIILIAIPGLYIFVRFFIQITLAACN